ncbi:hypothetical protein B0J12DRAFT_698610 [Macrophomina phaseolina]|uniref:GPI anchored serine-rich protein n=1 Tax=Macrophomina phaseolina TaxID=35725 RepID=A0ABQ8GEQ2_9PEZI|nr:hypothetical protein B0J12DRAFT_698610 [Macrophomina phaseolina]
MKFSTAVAIIATFTTPACAMQSASTTVTVSPCPSNTASVNDVVTRTPVAMPSQNTPCPTLQVVTTNGTTVTMSHPGAGSPGAGSSSTASSTPPAFTGAAVNNKVTTGGVLAAAFGLAAFIL